jgi:glycerophosphoryl diester phosphodiesterase
MWTDSEPPLVIAHRGDKVNAPENTLTAFRQAAEKGADAVEFDVKLSADGHVIVLHDQTVDRTTNGSGNAAKLPLASMRELDAGVNFSEEFKGERIPTLEEVFEEIGKRIYMNVELTNYSTPNDALVPKVVELINKHGLQNRILFSSFFSRNLHTASLLLPEVPRGLLTFPGLLGFWGRTFSWRGDYLALNPHLTDMNPGLVTRIHAAGKRINVWTVNTETQIKEMIKIGVDGIITDNPSLVLHLLGREQFTRS